jgi:carbon monoxide dehydrogenase subunit G
MLKALVVIAIIVVVALAAVLAYAATKPDTFRLSRATSIKAPPEKIFPFLNDLRSLATWSPYEKKDPAMKRTFGGVASGQGATYEWDGDKNVGNGRLTIADSSPPSKVTMKLDFISPWEAHNVVEFTLEPKGDTTNVTWAMHGPAPYMAKVMHVFINMDRMVGDDFEAGLSNLKALAEK